MHLSIRLSSVVLFALLAGCQSERVAFRFAPTPTTAAVSAPGAATPTPELAEVSAVLTDTEAKPMTYNSTVASQHRHSSFRVRRPQRAPAWAGHRPVARPAGFLGRHPAERVLLISGAGTTTLGLLLNYLAVGSSASTSTAVPARSMPGFWSGEKRASLRPYGNWGLPSMTNLKALPGDGKVLTGR